MFDIWDRVRIKDDAFPDERDRALRGRTGTIVTDLEADLGLEWSGYYEVVLDKPIDSDEIDICPVSATEIEKERSVSNMGYCRFQNTLSDLQDCYEHLFDEDLSADEELARQQLVVLCVDIAADDWPMHEWELAMERLEQYYELHPKEILPADLVVEVSS